MNIKIIIGCILLIFGTLLGISGAYLSIWPMIAIGIIIFLIGYGFFVSGIAKIERQIKDLANSMNILSMQIGHLNEDLKMHTITDHPDPRVKKKEDQ